MSLPFILILLTELTVHTLGCIAKDENATCVEAAITPTEENGGKFVDSMPQIASGSRLGWVIAVSKTTSGNTVNNQISIEKSTDPDTFYIGPFNGNGQTLIARAFACSKDSTASLSFKYYQCGSLDGEDKPAEQVDTLTYGLSTLPLDDNIMTVRKSIRDYIGLLTPNQPVAAETILVTRAQYVESTSICTPWTFGVLPPDGMPIELDVKADETFEVRFTVDHSGRAEWAAFSNVTVTCTAKDADKDGIADTDDNCKDKYNPYQKDRDHDGKGDKCDYDMDGDHVPNKYDYCPYEKGSYYNKGCPEYGRGGTGGGGYGRGDTDKKDDRGRAPERRGGSYSYSGSGSYSSSGRGRGRGSGSFSGSSSSGNSGRGRGGRSGKGYEYGRGGGEYKRDERKALEDLLRDLEEQYRGSSKY